MSHPDEGLIHAWLDGELASDEAARVEALIARDPVWAAAVAEARGLRIAATRIVQTLDQVPGDVIPRAPVAGTRPRRVRWWMMQVAAVLLVVAGTTVALRRDRAEIQATHESARPVVPVVVSPQAEPVKSIPHPPVFSEKRAGTPSVAVPLPPRVTGDRPAVALPSAPGHVANMGIGVQKTMPSPLEDRTAAPAAGATRLPSAKASATYAYGYASEADAMRTARPPAVGDCYRLRLDSTPDTQNPDRQRLTRAISRDRQRLLRAILDSLDAFPVRFASALHVSIRRATSLSASWTRVGPDSVYMDWPNAWPGVDVRFRFHLDRDSRMRGTVELHDGETVAAGAPIRAERIACPVTP